MAAVEYENGDSMDSLILEPSERRIDVVPWTDNVSAAANDHEGRMVRRRGSTRSEVESIWPVTQSLVEIPHSKSTEQEQRQCTICFGDETECPGSEWCRPCRCRGTSRWVHKSCILRWIDEKQKKKGLDWPVKCEQCQYLYQVRLPSPSVLERAKATTDEVIHFMAPFGAFALCTGGLLYVSFKLGVISSRVVAGEEVTDQWLHSQYNFVPTLACTMTPMALLGFGAIKWEHLIMRGLLWAWARSCHAARLISHRISGPKEDPARRLIDLVDMDPTLNPPVAAVDGEPLAPEVDYSRVIVTSLALPFTSAFCGRLIFNNKPWSMLQKSLCGGLVYLLATGAVSVVCKLQSEGRRKSRWIEDFQS